jgi:hypothetical protein
MAYKKGESGNPLGRPAGLAEINWKALKACPEVMDELISLALDRDVDNKIRIAAMKEVLDRGMGKSIQSIRLEDKTVQEPSKMATQDLELMLQGGIDILKEQIRQQVKSEILGSQMIIEKKSITSDNNVVSYEGDVVNIEVNENEMGEMKHRLECNLTEENSHE